MTTLTKGVIWPPALLLLAVGNAAGLIADQPANTLFVILPLMAVITMRRSACCTAAGPRA